MKNLLFSFFFFVVVSPVLNAQWQWQNPKNVANIKDLGDVHFVGSQKGWAVGNSGTIKKTTDGGVSW